MEMTCRICGFRGDEQQFVSSEMNEHSPDWVCPKCKCGGYSPSTLCEDFFDFGEVSGELS